MGQGSNASIVSFMGWSFSLKRGGDVVRGFVQKGKLVQNTEVSFSLFYEC